MGSTQAEGDPPPNQGAHPSWVEKLVAALLRKFPFQHRGVRHATADRIIYYRIQSGPLSHTVEGGLQKAYPTIVGQNAQEIYEVHVKGAIGVVVKTSTYQS